MIALVGQQSRQVDAGAKVILVEDKALLEQGNRLWEVFYFLCEHTQVEIRIDLGRTRNLCSPAVHILGLIGLVLLLVNSAKAHDGVSILCVHLQSLLQLNFSFLHIGSATLSHEDLS